MTAWRACRCMLRFRFSTPSALRDAGDLTYADAFDQDASPRGSPDSGSAASGAKWDAWGRLTSPLFAQARHRLLWLTCSHPRDDHAFAR